MPPYSLKSDIVVLTGAGISAESGLTPYRGGGAGDDPLWSQYDFHTVATPEAFEEDPALVHEFYNLRRQKAGEAEPNIAHEALVSLESAIASRGGRFTLISQNVDDLHQRAGSRNLLAMHGSLMHVRCLACGSTLSWTVNATPLTPCPECAMTGQLRPDVVWFGEQPRFLDHIEDAMETAELFISIGTSGTVYPAAGLVAKARASGAVTIELNLDPSDNGHLFDQGHYGPASRVVPDFVAQLMAKRWPDR